MLDIFVLEEDYFQQARLEDAIHKSKQIYILRIGKVDLYDKPDQLLERITERGSHLLFFLDIGSDSDVEGEYWLLNRFVSEIRMQVLFSSQHIPNSYLQPFSIA